MKKLLFLIFTLSVFVFSSCENVLPVSYKMENNSSYTVEFTLDGENRSLNAGESSTEKRSPNPTVTLTNNVPVYFYANYASVYFENKTLQTVKISVKNTLSEVVVLDFNIQNIDNVEIDKMSEKSFTLSDIEINSKDNIFSNLTAKLKDSNYNVNYTLNENNGIYYILIN